MASILDKYGIKEVADVMFYELDKEGAPSAPVLYLDTLKVSTLEQSAETVDATGGKSNVKLLTWDTNKELTLTLEDALFSAKSLGIMFGGTAHDTGVNQEVLKTIPATGITNEDSTTISFEIKGQKYYVKKASVACFVYNPGDAVPTAVPSADVTWTDFNFDFVTFDLLDCSLTTTAPTKTGNADVSGGIVKNGVEIDISAEFNDNTYYITGDTYARNANSGKDEFLQFIVPKGKVSAEDVSLTMEADGDPATFSMTVNCLKAKDGSMLKLVKYELESNQTSSADSNKGVASVLDQYNSTGEHAPWADTNAVVTTSLSEGSPSDTPKN